MPIYRNNQNSDMTDLMSSVESLIVRESTDLVGAEDTRMVVSFESLQSDRAQEFDSRYDNIRKGLEVVIDSHDLKLTEEGLTAATIATMAVGNAAEYNNRVNTVSMESGGISNVVEPMANIGIGGHVSTLYKPSMEAFDNTTLDTYRSNTIVFNAFAAPQDKFGEGFFPVRIMTPDANGIDIEVLRCVVQGDIVHEADSPLVDGFERQLLTDAVVDPTILDNNATQIVPQVLEDDSNLDYFVDPDLVKPVVIEVGKNKVKTAPLALNVRTNLLSLSSGSAATAGQNLTNSDSIEPAVRLHEILITVKNEDGTEVDVVRPDVARIPSATYYRNPNGDGRELTLSFSSRELVLSEETKSIGGALPEALAALAGKKWVLTIGVDVTGSLNTETGAGVVNASPVDLVRLTDASNNVIAMDEGEAAAILGAINLEVFGYTVDARRSNLNHRTRGLLVDNISQTERHPIPLDSPITTITPTAGGDAQGNAMRSMIAAAKIRRANNNVTTLINYFDALKSGIVYGAGRHLVKPYWNEIDLDMEKRINSDRSHEKSADVKAVLVDAIRDVAYSMNRDSNYSTALEFYTNSTSEKPRLLIGTDRVITEHLMVPGDERTAGIGFDHEIVETDDVRMKDTIYMTFSRKNEGQKLSGLSFGFNAYVPAMTANVQTSRGQETVLESRIQPRNISYPVLPILVKINVKNLSKVLNNRT